MTQSKRRIIAEQKPRSHYSIFPWQCRYHKDRSEIIAYVEASGQWEIVSTVRNTSGANSEAMANFICYLINEHQKNTNLLNAAMDALRLCVEEAELTFASEQAADSVLRQADKILHPLSKTSGRKKTK